MADTKITALTALTAADPINDVIPIVDVSDTSMAASGTTKKISVNNILSSSPTASGALTVTGLVTAGSATITGDLTVRTNKLKVDATGVGIGTASPTSGTLTVQTHYLLFPDSQTKIGDNGLVNGVSSDGNSQIQFFGGKSLFFNEGASNTKMTLNATGLGIGASPTTKLDVLGSGDGELRLRAGSDAALIFSETAQNKNWKLKPSGGDFQFQYSATAYNSGYSPLMILTATGNLGIGVTPSAWATYKAVSVGGIGASVFGLGSSQGGLVQGAYYSNLSGSGWAYTATSQVPAYYLQINGEHRFHNAISGTAGAQITAWNQAMTLDASGNLLVGTVTAPAGTKVGAIAKLSGVSLEGTAAINVSTTPVALAKSLGTGGLFFVTGYNTSGGAQCWFLVASQQAVAPTVIASSNSTGLTVAFTLVGGIVYMNTTSGTIAVNSFAITN